MQPENNFLIKLIAVDIDGTLLNSKHKLTERTKTAVKQAIGMGIKFMFATGKTYTSAKFLFSELGVTTPGVFGQGTIVYNADGTIRHQVSLPNALLRRMIPFIEERNGCIMVYSGESILMKQADSRSDILVKHHEPAPTYVGSLINALEKHAFNKIIISGTDPKHARSLHWQLNHMIGKEVTMTFAGIPQQFEVLPLGISKGKAVAALAKELGIPAANVLGIGDAENDVDLLNFAGVSVAMGNAPDAIKAFAKYTTSSNDLDGVAEALERFVLPKPIAAEVEPKPVVAEEKPNA